MGELIYYQNKMFEVIEKEGKDHEQDHEEKDNKRKDKEKNENKMNTVMIVVKEINFIIIKSHIYCS